MILALVVYAQVKSPSEPGEINQAEARRLVINVNDPDRFLLGLKNFLRFRRNGAYLNGREVEVDLLHNTVSNVTQMIRHFVGENSELMAK